MYNSFKPVMYDSMPLVSTLSAVFAKSSVVWSTLFYILTNRTIKSKLFPFVQPNRSMTLAARRDTRFSSNKTKANRLSRKFSMLTLNSSSPKNKKLSKSSRIITNCEETIFLSVKE